MNIPLSLRACSSSCVCQKFTGLVARFSATQTVAHRPVTHGKGHKTKQRRSIAFLGVPVAMGVSMEIVPLENIFGGVSKCPRDVW